jgi:hypothetical protein
MRCLNDIYVKPEVYPGIHPPTNASKKSTKRTCACSCIKYALVLNLFMLTPIIPVTGSIGLYVLIFRPSWFKKLVDNMYANKTD